MTSKEKLPPQDDVVHYTDLPPELKEVRLGVWSVIMERKPPFKIPGWNDLCVWRKTATTSALRLAPFVTDVYAVVGPPLFLAYLASHFWNGIEAAVFLYVSSNLLNKIESSFMSGSADPWTIGTALALRLVALIVGSTIRWNSIRLLPIVQTRVKLHFQQRIMQTHLRLDLTTSQDNSSKFSAEPTQAWFALCHLLDLVVVIFAIISQLAFVRSLANDQDGGYRLALLCIVGPLSMFTRSKNLWTETFAVYASNRYYVRAKALYKIATSSTYKQEVLANGSADYLQREFQKTEDALEGVPDDHAASLYRVDKTPFATICIEFFRDLPLLVYALECILHPARFSVTTLAMLQQTSGQLRWTFERLKLQKSTMREDMNYLKSLYEGMSVENEIGSGTLHYPSPSESEKGVKRGMGIELRNVTFAYSDDPEAHEALQNVSITLPASSLVVIVGANGSGKSSLVKLLTNLHRPKSGQILVDAHPIDAYRSSDLRKATALLTQDHSVFPLTLRENIGLGDPDHAMDMERIQEAAKLGGAAEYVAKLPKKFDEILHPFQTNYASQYPIPPGPLKDMMNKVEKSSDLSGGETQRLVASRTFMRILSGSIRLLVVDEPTSAMDPQGEFELFERLRSMREGMTTVFVTHRFGHLTKHADLILCMKDGKLVESGTHHELMQTKNEYFNLYNIQAQAFVEKTTESSK